MKDSMGKFSGWGFSQSSALSSQPEEKKRPYSYWPVSFWLLAGLILTAVAVAWILAQEPEPAEETERMPALTAAKPPKKPDDLTRIKGIGPKTMAVLNEQGIFTFEQLAKTDVSFLERLMAEQRWHMADPASWSEQARRLNRQ